MMACIKVKEKQFKHQIVYSGDGDRVHCVFWCGLGFSSMQESVEAFESERLIAATRWPEGAEL